MVILNRVDWMFLYGLYDSGSARPEVRGTAEPHGGAYPHEVRPLVRTHVYHPYHAADRQAETDS